MQLFLSKTGAIWSLALILVISSPGAAQRVYSAPPNCAPEYLKAVGERPDTASWIRAVQRCGEEGGRLLAEVVRKHRGEKDSMVIRYLYRAHPRGMPLTDANLLAAAIDVATDRGASTNARLGAIMTLLSQYSSAAYFQNNVFQSTPATFVCSVKETEVIPVHGAKRPDNYVSQILETFDNIIAPSSPKILQTVTKCARDHINRLEAARKSQIK